MKIIGHRGAKGLAPENTIKSLEKALQHKVDMVEIDVHVTKDGVPVLSHDDTVHNPGGQSFKVSDHEYSSLLEHKPDLATLEEAIAFIDKRVPFYIEVKERQVPGPIIAIIQDFMARGWKPEDFLIASFDFRLLKQVHIALPEIPVVIGERWWSARGVYRANQLQTRSLSMDQRWLWRGFITSMTRRGWKIYAYTMNSPRRAKRFGRYGVYAIFTDYPDQHGE